MIFNLFSLSAYNAVSVLSTNKLVQNISTCNPLVIFVSNHCSPTIFMYPHFLALQLSSISNRFIYFILIQNASISSTLYNFRHFISYIYLLLLQSKRNLYTCTKISPLGLDNVQM